MKRLKTFIKEEKVRRGLHQARVGDAIYIGMKGTRGKWYSKVKKVDSKTGRITDRDGNIFNPDGQIYRRKTYPFKQSDTVSAKIVSQKDFDKQYKKIKIDFLRKFDWDRMDIKEIEKIIDMMPVGQGNVLGKSRFEK